MLKNIVGLALMLAIVAIANYLRSNRAQDEVEYTHTPSGFRYRLLDVGVAEGWDAAVAKLLPGERLYRMMPGEYYSPPDRLYPTLVVSEQDFEQCMRMRDGGRWRFQWAAGTPSDKPQSFTV